MSATELILSVRELENLRALFASFEQAKREFGIAFSQSCYSREKDQATFVGFTQAGMLVQLPEEATNG